MHIVYYLPSEGRTANLAPIFMSGKIMNSSKVTKTKNKKKADAPDMIEKQANEMVPGRGRMTQKSGGVGGGK